ncbi:Modification methylase HphIA [Escovopsis weberi]|uniref:DNA (cytosine-5-)-methyltransferase n=1 Tax=Escovopsis weberi TaxID=150374 RepID=A0A0N0RT43_ESCWE|nr:Modification methylase HphIA [Escovopsis weberi]
MPPSRALRRHTSDGGVQFLNSRTFARNSRSSSVESSVTAGREASEPAEYRDDEVIDLDAYEADLASPGLLQAGELPLESFRLACGTVIRREDLIQIRPFSLGAYKVEFVLVKIIAQDRAGTKKIRGVPLARSRTLAGTLPKKINEISMILHVQRLGNVAAQPHLVDVGPGLIEERRTLILTNSLYRDQPYNPWASFQNIEEGDPRRRMVELHGHLVCRWKLVIYFTPHGRTGRPEETAFERVLESEVRQQQHRESEGLICERWRGGRIRGGSWRPNAFGQKYTLFDSFSGAGGVSRGAQSSGFHIQGAVDKSPEVWDTYRLNFSTELFKMSIDEFILATRDRIIRPDVLHLSPPCQFFSPAHTHVSANDDTNIFALFSCHTLIDKLRPRLITLEQTFGITHDRHGHYLSRLIGDFTELGYSVRWKIVRLAAWGLAQSRKRLIMIAAGPGERLPPFPDDTHSETGAGGLKRFTTVRQAISGLRRGDDLHNVASTKHHYPPRPRLNADGLMGTITTGGGEAYYPDGTRDFTLREYACLQGFPQNHRFSGNITSIRRQIGNAFPPNTVQVLYRHLNDWLLKEDGISGVGPPRNTHVVTVDDDDVVDSEDVMEVSRGSQQSSFGVGSLPEMEDIIAIDAASGSSAFIDLT